MRDTKTCSKCSKNKPLTEFSKSKTCKDRLRPECKVCIKEYNTIYYDKNKDKIDKQAKDYAQNTNNTERISKYKRRYFLNHKEKISNYQKEYYQSHKSRINQLLKEKKKNNPQFRLACSLRTRMGALLRGKIKACHSMDLLGCTFSFAKQWIESKFLPGMTWQNWSKTGWHIDHIRPIDSFYLTDLRQQKECFHYTNLQPLWHLDNLKKGAKWPLPQSSEGSSVPVKSAPQNSDTDYAPDSVSDQADTNVV